MARSPRPIVPGGIYHVVSRGTRRLPVFEDDHDRRLFIRLLGLTVPRFEWRCFAYCLMTNHYHLVVQTPEPTISTGMHFLNGRYAQLFNERHGVQGHVFERRFWSVVVERERHLLQLARYVVLNPQRGGICSFPGDWPWSSYCATAGTARIPAFLSVEWVQELLGGDPQTRPQRYAQFVAAAGVE
jgi:putative transposase